MLNVALRTARPTPLASLLNPASAVANLWSHRDLTRQFAVRYFESRYKGTHLGLVWAMLFPLLMLAVYTFVFTYIFSGRSAGDTETRPQYAVWLFCGMSVFGVFSSATTRACGLVLENPQYVTKVVFPLEVLPISNLGSSLFYAACEMALVLLGVGIFHHAFHWTVVLLPVAMLPLLLLTLGVSWFLASLTVFVRDIANVVSLVVSQFLFFLTPIFWKPAQLLATLPDLAWMIEWNPLAGVVENARRCVLSGESLDWRSWALGTLLGLVVAQCGYAWFVKSKRGFADVL
ncbi:MAG: ABC transporter permease [Phycisphaerales bacterium]